MPHYLDPIRFKALVVSFQSQTATQAESEELALALHKLASEYLKTFKNVPEHLRDELATDAYLTCWSKLHKFNPDRPNSNAFNYFTTIARNAILHHLRNERRHENTRLRYIEQLTRNPRRP